MTVCRLDDLDLMRARLCHLRCTAVWMYQRFCNSVSHCVPIHHYSIISTAPAGIIFHTSLVLWCRPDLFSEHLFLQAFFCSAIFCTAHVISFFRSFRDTLQVSWMLLAPSRHVTDNCHEMLKQAAYRNSSISRHQAQVLIGYLNLASDFFQGKALKL